jgi:hypothetical protein
MDSKEFEGLKHEYTEANSYLRHYSSLRFVMFSVYFAVMAGVISLAFGIVNLETSSPYIIRLLIRMGGLLTTFVFSMYEYRLEYLIRHYQTLAKELEEKLGYSQMRRREQSNVTFIATWILYASVFLFWLFVMVRKA